MSGFLGGAVVKNPPANASNVKRYGFNPWVVKIPWRREWQPTPVFMPEKTLWTEEPGGLQSLGLQRVRHNWAQTHRWMRKHQTNENGGTLYKTTVPFSSKITRSKRSRKQWGRVYDTISTWPWTGSFHHKGHSWENWPNSSGVWGYGDGDESQLISWCYGCMAVMEEDVLVCRNTRWRIWFWWVIRLATYS